MTTGLAYVGKVVDISPIENADKIESLTVVCGKGGKWRAVAQKGTFEIGSVCEVYLQDSILPTIDKFLFLEKHNYRIRMQRLRNAPSEALVMPLTIVGNIGDDITELMNVTKYSKPVPAGFEGQNLGSFPSFIPKTDEPNFQTVPEIVDFMRGKEFYSTVKVDGMSLTIYNYKDHFGVCSRTLEKKNTENNKLWQIAVRYDLERQLKDYNIALQFELAGPGIQGNRLGLKELTPFLYNVWDIEEQKYMNVDDAFSLAADFDIPTVTILNYGFKLPTDITEEEIRKWAEIKYPNGNNGEGIVIRPLIESFVGPKRASFKVINLLYEN